MDPEPQAAAPAPASPAPAAAEEQGAWVLGAASIGVSAIALVLVGAMVIARFVPALQALPMRTMQMVQGMVFILACGAAFLGLGLGVGGLFQKGASKVLPAVGLALNAGLLLVMACLIGLALVMTSRVASRLGALPAAGAPAQATDVAREKADIESKLGAEMGSAAHDGYSRVTVADLVADPNRYASSRVYFSGFYSGTSPDNFAVYGLWAKGGIVWVDGSGLSVDKKKDLLVRLDGFHRVLIRGTFAAQETPRRSSGLGGGVTGTPQFRVRADDVIDLGRDPSPNAP
jgi:hypothetical protein